MLRQPNRVSMAVDCGKTVWITNTITGLTQEFERVKRPQRAFLLFPTPLSVTWLRG